VGAECAGGSHLPQPQPYHTRGLDETSPGHPLLLISKFLYVLPNRSTEFLADTIIKHGGMWKIIKILNYPYFTT
jgi:hypothetical protein